ncbi:aldolase/citrate lyase family protein [Curtobacterium sp. MCBD17_003]|uniref:HpcH/HpaI aldolase family protein n=1 Tax=Curtobacterium sp. MCBD17_003 TaxID=2175667 RepID=UPI0011B501CC|nr:aldolase/citrate lyase family protein [Curtobacterium sp. MCBD17_003]WIE53960.1 aldolase/citrate lyase family protein [Curtobacterium sp. MCBD17_003]
MTTRTMHSAATTSDDPLWGLWSNYASPRVVGSLAASGAPWICVDEQHGYPPDDLAATIGAGLARDVTMVVRVAWNRPELIGRALDAGASGIIVPMVEDPSQAQSAARACHYPPLGARSFGPARRAFGVEAAYGGHAPEDEPQCLVMVESAAALTHVEEIAQTEGVDGIFVGPFDLALALGVALDDLLADHSSSAPLVRIAAACRRAGILAAAYGGTPERARVLAAHGFGLVVAGTDDGILRDGWAGIRAGLAAGAEERGATGAR